MKLILPGICVLALVVILHYGLSAAISASPWWLIVLALIGAIILYENHVASKSKRTDSSGPAASSPPPIPVEPSPPRSTATPTPSTAEGPDEPERSLPLVIDDGDPRVIVDFDACDSKPFPPYFEPGTQPLLSQALKVTSIVQPLYWGKGNTLIGKYAFPGWSGWNPLYACLEALGDLDPTSSDWRHHRNRLLIRWPQLAATFPLGSDEELPDSVEYNDVEDGREFGSAIVARCQDDYWSRMKVAEWVESLGPQWDTAAALPPEPHSGLIPPADEFDADSGASLRKAKTRERENGQAELLNGLFGAPALQKTPSRATMASSQATHSFSDAKAGHNSKNAPAHCSREEPCTYRFWKPSSGAVVATCEHTDGEVLVIAPEGRHTRSPSLFDQDAPYAYYPLGKGFKYSPDFLCTCKEVSRLQATNLAPSLVDFVRTQERRA